MATPSYKERMRAARAEASAQRKAQRSDELRQLELVCEARRFALEAVKIGIRARGEKLSLYSHAQLVTMANTSISPFLKAQASLKRMQMAWTRTRTRMIEQNSTVKLNSESPANQPVLLNETHAQNGAAR